MLFLSLLLSLVAICIHAGSSPRNRRTPLGEFRINKAKSSKMFKQPLSGPQFEAEKRERIEAMVENSKQAAEISAKKRAKEVERRAKKIAKAKERKAAISYKQSNEVVQSKKQGQNQEEEDEEDQYSVPSVRVTSSSSLDIDTSRLMDKTEKNTRISSTGGMNRLRTLIRSKKNER